jgi:hypothetical protein
MSTDLPSAAESTNQDFDFLTGSWTIANRRLRKILAGSTEWDEFSATSTCARLFDGAANIDEMFVPARGFSGLSLRLFEPGSGQWSIYWVNSRDGKLEPPVVGGFVDGVGTFYGDDVFEGAPIRVRFTWSHITPTTARWQQAFSVDGEATWETNWIMDLTR